MQAERLYLEVDGRRIPVDLFRERRKTARIALGKSAVLLRLPTKLNRKQEADYYRQLTTWLRDTFRKRPELFERYNLPNYSDGDTLTVGARSYALLITKAVRKTSKGRLIGPGQIELTLAADLSPTERPAVVRSLLHRIVARDFLPAIQQRVRTLNDTHFQQPISDVRLRYNTSNWGSCSSRGSISLSTRLLCAPDWVIDYVIIHELAHRLEMNHSEQFWALVERAMPDYLQAEQWLKANDSNCHF